MTNDASVFVKILETLVENPQAEKVVLGQTTTLRLNHNPESSAGLLSMLHYYDWDLTVVSAIIMDACMQIVYEIEPGQDTEAQKLLEVATEIAPDIGDRLSLVAEMLFLASCMARIALTPMDEVLEQIMQDPQHVILSMLVAQGQSYGEV